MRWRASRQGGDDVTERAGASKKNSHRETAAEERGNGEHSRVLRLSKLA